LAQFELYFYFYQNGVMLAQFLFLLHPLKLCPRHSTSLHKIVVL